MQSNINHWLAAMSKVGVMILGLSTFLLVANFTTEFYETPKFLALSIFVGIIFILTALKSISEGKLVLNITPLDLPLLLLLIVAIVSTFISPAPHISLQGSVAKVSSGLIFLVVLALFYYSLVNNLKSQVDAKQIIGSLIVGGIILSILAILSYSGVSFLPLSWAKSLNFTLTGSSFNTAAVLAILLPFPLLGLLKPSTPTLKLTSAIMLTLFGVTIVLIGQYPTYIAAIFATILTFLVVSPFSAAKNLPYLIIPAAIIALVAALSFIPPVGNVKNPLYNQAQKFPREIQLDFVSSWKISASSFRDNPFVGSGPATYLYNFTQYKPIEFNSTKFWNLRFDSAFNEYLGILGTLGGLGLLAFLLLFLSFVRSSFKVFSVRAEDHFGHGLAIAGLTFFALLAFHSLTLVVGVIGFLILALFMATQSHLTKSIHMSLGKMQGSDRASFDVLPGMLLVLVLILIGAASFYIGKLAIADFHHRTALNAVSQNKGLDAYNSLVQAEKFNPYSDLYRTDLAQTNFALANAIASSKGPTESSPGGSLTDADRTNIQQLLQQAITEGRVAVTLSPRSAGNYEILGSIYRQISGVAQNALQFALDSYGRAIQKDPLNPILRLNVGGIYYSIKNYDLAIRFFSDGANLKPDWPNAYYNLSVALRDKGDLKGAQAAAEKTISLLDQNSQDYQTALVYLNDLKDRIATGSAQASEIEAPAGQATSPLQKNQKPVLDLPKPDSIATPPAVKR